MKIKKALTAIALCFMLVFASMLCGCGTTDNKTSEPESYDVTIKLVSNLGDEWIFTPDIEKMSVTFDYTGEEMRIWVDTYNLPDHPRWKDLWLSPDIYGVDGFRTSILFKGSQEGEGWEKEVQSICERGTYCVISSTRGTFFYSRTVDLYISVK